MCTTMAMATIPEDIDASKQATKALKCVAFTSKQVEVLLHRKHERVEKRIRSISEEIESLKGDVSENITHQRERRQHLSEIEEDLEQAQLLGDSKLVEDLLEEIEVLKEEGKREEALYKALTRTIRSRQHAKKQFQQEKVAVETELRNFTCKQQIIQTLLVKCAKQSSLIDTIGSSSSSQSDCGASDLDGFDDGPEGLSSSGSDNASEPTPRCAPPVTMSTHPKWHKSVSLASPSTQPATPVLRVRSMSSDGIEVSRPERIETRTRHSLSVHFASPILTVTTIDSREEDLLTRELASLDLSTYESAVAESGAQVASSNVEPHRQESSSAQPVEAATKGPEVAAIAKTLGVTAELVEASGADCATTAA